MGDEGVVVMGLDPGFASFGWCCCRVKKEPVPEIQPLAAGVIRTQKQGQKERVYAADDNLSRARLIHSGLVFQLDRHRPRALLAEAMSFPRSASVAAKMALSWGLVAACSFSRRIPILQVTPQRLKQALSGKRDASKQEVEASCLARLGDWQGVWGGLLKQYPAGQHEHMNDALAALITCLDAEAVQLLCG